MYVSSDTEVHGRTPVQHAPETDRRGAANYRELSAGTVRVYGPVLFRRSRPASEALEWLRLKQQRVQARLPRSTSECTYLQPRPRDLVSHRDLPECQGEERLGGHRRHRSRETKPDHLNFLLPQKFAPPTEIQTCCKNGRVSTPTESVMSRMPRRD